MKIKYNAPVILTYAIFSLTVLFFFSHGWFARFFISPSQMDLTSLEFYLRQVLHIAGHEGFRHLMGNFMVILLVGPLLEEKYGSINLLEMIVLTAFVTGFLNTAVFHTSIKGASGIAFMMILLSSFSNIKSKEIPLTFIFVAVIFVTSEVLSAFRLDRISQFSHLAGGCVGAAYGFFRK